MKRECKRNPIAKALRSPHLRPKVVANRKLYSRKADRKVRLDDFWTCVWLPLAISR